MKKLLQLTFLFLLSTQLSAQNPGDTIVVQTFIHDAWTDGAGNSTGSGSRVYKIGTGTDGSWVVHQNAANAHIIMEIAG